MDRDEALRIVDSLYAAALGEASWQATLSAVADAVGGVAATLELQDMTRERVVFFDSAGIDPASIPLYVDHYGAINPRARAMLNLRRCITFDQLFISEEEMDRHPFYAEFLAASGLRYFIGAQTPLIDGRLKGVLAVQRSGQVRGISSEHLQVMQALSPHVVRAIALFWTRMRLKIDPDHLDCALARNGLTPAERRLAAAICLGETLACYARRNRLSMNTVYTHYRHVKEKLDAARAAELLARLRAM